MKKQKFLTKLFKEGKLDLVEPSNEISNSYIQKAENCFKSAKLLLSNNLLENSVINSYYAMYNSLLSLLFKIGIKSENHSGSIMLLEEIFNLESLYKIIEKAKEERIDKQYYVETKGAILEKESAKETLENAEDFLMQIKILIESLTNEQITKFRNKFREIIEK